FGEALGGPWAHDQSPRENLPAGIRRAAQESVRLELDELHGTATSPRAERRLARLRDAGCTLPILRFASWDPVRQMRRAVDTVVPGFRRHASRLVRRSACARVKRYLAIGRHIRVTSFCRWLLSLAP